MNTFKRKSLYAAVLAGLGAVGAAGSAGAVQLSQDGTGQALIYPYYTVRTSGAGDFATYLNVVNTTNSTKAVKVRFLEGKNSREVLDFNLYLSPRDVWSGAISRTASGAKLTSADNSCVTDSGGFAQSVAAGKVYPEFVNYAFIGSGGPGWGWTTGWDGEDQSLDRTREGYFEIIEMGNIIDATITTGLKHNSAGVPANCGVVANINAGNVVAPTGGLIGGASLINVNAGSDYGYDPVVLEDFAQLTGNNNLWYAAGSISPDMSNAGHNSKVFYYHDYVTDTVASTWWYGEDAVSAVLARDSVMNTYILDTATLSSTDWIVTFPTKRNYVGANDPANGAMDPNRFVFPPFHNTFWTGGSCDPISMTTWDREEQTFSSNVQSSPPKPGQTNNLCWEANVITFKNGTASLADADTLLGSKNRLEVSTPYEHGWAKLNLSASTPLTSNDGNTYAGLPVVGFMVQDFLNTNVTIGGLPSASSYGGNFVHKFTRTITKTPVPIN
jgi:hypothetical protein